MQLYDKVFIATFVFVVIQQVQILLFKTIPI